MQYVNTAKRSKVQAHPLASTKPIEADRIPEGQEEAMIELCKVKIKGTCIGLPRSSAPLLTPPAARMKTIWNPSALFDLTDNTATNGSHEVNLHASSMSGKPPLYTMSAEDRATAYRVFAVFFDNEDNTDIIRATVGQRLTEEREKSGMQKSAGLHLDGGHDSECDVESTDPGRGADNAQARVAETRASARKSGGQKARAHAISGAEDKGARGGELECGVGIDVAGRGRCEREGSAEDDNDSGGPLEWLRVMLRDMGVRDKGVREVPPPTPSEDMRESWSDGCATFDERLRSSERKGVGLGGAESEAGIRDEVFVGERDGQVVESAVYCNSGTLSYSGVLTHAQVLLSGAC